MQPLFCPACGDPRFVRDGRYPVAATCPRQPFVCERCHYAATVQTTSRGLLYR